MKRIFFIIPALCLTLVFGCDENRRAAESEGYQDTEGLNEAEFDGGNNDDELTEEVNTDEPFYNPNTDESVGGEGSYDVKVEKVYAEGIEEEVQEFLASAASSSLLEIEMAQLAQERAQSQEVKEYARMIEEDHRQANEKLRNIAQEDNFNLPQTMMQEHESKMKELREISGSDFDQKYMSMQVDLHQKDIEKFESMQQDIQDQEIQQWVGNTLPVLRKHLEQAQQVQEQI